MDPNGEAHYTLTEIFEGQISLPPTNEAVTFGYYGTDCLYANPLLVKIAMAAWQHYPDCHLLAERQTEQKSKHQITSLLTLFPPSFFSYWRRASNALASGFIPQAAELADSLNRVFGVTVTPDCKLVALPERASVKLLYQWFREERAEYPQNSVVVNASSHHFLPHPIVLHGPGAWATVDLMYFGPDVPSTYGNECNGETQWAGAAALSAPAAVAGLDIAAHYAHRARLRSTYRVLRDGGFMPLLTFWGESQNSWHDRVFAFARVAVDKAKKKEKERRESSLFLIFVVSTGGSVCHQFQRRVVDGVSGSVASRRAVRPERRLDCVQDSRSDRSLVASSLLRPIRVSGRSPVPHAGPLSLAAARRVCGEHVCLYRAHSL